MFAPTLAPHQQTAVLAQLGCSPNRPNLQFLQRLVDAYVRTVPWESAFRIVKRASCDDLQACSRWSVEFWQDNLQRGGGGTCFESNYAFSALLHGLGYEGYLVINNMEESIGCHTAIIVLLEGEKWLVDAGFPLYTPLPINPTGITQRDSLFQRYTVRPVGPDRYQIERQPHPNPYTFTLIDQPVILAEYRQATTADYGPDGHFLQRVIVHKILDEQMWRFNSGEQPPQLTCFADGHRFDTIIEGDVATAVAAKFEIDEVVIRRALDLVSVFESGPEAGEGD
jgi:arylamine N-acetyltransferase